MTDDRSERTWTDRLTEKVESGAAESLFKELQPQPPRQLSHYTTPIGLKGIVESRRLWASSATFLNDDAEMLYMDTIVAPVVQEITARSDARSVREFGDRSARIRLSMFAERFGVFVTCFCEDPDLLSQWRGYGVGGFSIGFDTRNWTEPVPGHGESAPDAKLWRVEYSEEKQRLFVSSVVEPIVAALELEEGARGGDQVIVDCVAPALGVLQNLLWTTAFWFKHPGFSEEREWRLVVIQDLASYTPGVMPGPPPLETHVRPAPYGFVPYIEVPFETSPRPAISSIFIGPSARPELARRGVAELSRLSELKHKQIQVYGSDVPLRT